MNFELCPFSFCLHQVSTMERKISLSSSSSSSPPVKKYDVFLSFRGEDTRNNFMSHLSLALRKIGLFNIFKDDYALDKGKEIGPELLNAIEDSQYAVVVLSENYATSSWCLKEVTKIVECMGDSGRIRTIFYHVNPSHVRNVISSDEQKQKESSFWKALEEHAQNPTHSESLESWKNALVKVANQSGYPVEDHTDEANFINEFVTKISSELGASTRNTDDLFGMTSRLKELDSYVLRSSSANNVSFIGICGMGGIGKSTLARAYYKLMSHRFEGSSFLENVREGCEKKTNGLVDFQKQLLSDILGGSFEEIRHVDNGIDMIRSRLSRKKVLVVLDDVNKLEPLNALAKEDKWFGSDSVIIVTTREDSFLKVRRYKIVRAAYLNPSEALQLFSSKAFGTIEPPKEYQKLSEEVVEYASYLPLALTVLGSLLSSKKISEWESALRRLRKFPEKQIVETLKIGFDDLNHTDQQIFLDIACFFNGYEKYSVIQILDSCGFESEYGISNLIDKSLLSIHHGSIIWMHDLIQEMGKEIVRKESGNQLGRQSRIWDAADLYHVLENEEGTDKVEAIVTVLDNQTMQLSFEGLSYMKKLRLLMMSGFLPERDGPELKYLCNDLKFLQWNGFCYSGFPSSFQPRKLVHLMAWESNIERLWNNCIKRLDMLKVIDLSYSEHFSKFEDFTVVPNLERLILEGCTNLLEIHPSIKGLTKLILLNLSVCTSLKWLPEEINGLASLQILDLYGCSMLCHLPDNLDKLKSLRNLDLRGTGVKHLPSSIFLMKNLESLRCSNEEDMTRSSIRKNIIIDNMFGKFLPGNLCDSLTWLDLNCCNLTCEEFPEYFGKLLCLNHLDLSKNPFTVIPTGIKGLSSLKSLKLEHCVRLQCLDPELLPSSLEEVNVNYCTSLTSFLDPLKYCHLRCYSISCADCTELVKRQDGIKTALASLNRFLQCFSNRTRKFQIVIPLLHPQSDIELPAWFIKTTSSRESVSIKLDPNRRNNELIGVAMVFCLAPSSPGDYSFCRVRVGGCNISNATAENIVHTFHIRITQSLDHLVILYIPYDHLPISCRRQLESPNCDSLEFLFCAGSARPCSGSGDHAFSCEPCGVRLIYENDIDTLKEITSNYIDESPNQMDHLRSSKSVLKGKGVRQDILIPISRDVSPKQLRSTPFSPAPPVCYPSLKLKLKTAAAIIILLHISFFYMFQSKG